MLKLGETGRHNESSASGRGTWQVLKLGETGRHNESSASGQGTWQLLKLGETGRHNESSASGRGTWQLLKLGGTMRALQVERLQRRRDLAGSLPPNGIPSYMNLCWRLKIWTPQCDLQ